MHGTALVTHPVRAFDALLLCSTSTIASLALLVRVQCLVVKELLQSDQEHVALHGTDAARRHDALRLAERAEKRLARSDLRLGQARFEALEAEAVKTRQQLGSIELVAANRTVKQVVDCGRRVAAAWCRVGLSSTMIDRCRHFVNTGIARGA